MYERIVLKEAQETRTIIAKIIKLQSRFVGRVWKRGRLQHLMATKKRSEGKDVGRFGILAQEVLRDMPVELHKGLGVME